MVGGEKCFGWAQAYACLVFGRWLLQCRHFFKARLHAGHHGTVNPIISSAICDFAKRIQMLVPCGRPVYSTPWSNHTFAIEEGEPHFRAIPPGFVWMHFVTSVHLSLPSLTRVVPLARVEQV
ncbi:hypothetical protein GFL78_28905 [Rhizobium leguminosarum bv. viciae]|nr:hypothetical protein [Rhizobium leguminosarum bv. viciae]TCA83797.1 hypothetical protein E0H65_35235 [Rhizobium leguminosarum bv. viciae]